MTNPTIFSLCSGAGKCGVAVIRVSGPVAGHIMREVTGDFLPDPRHAKLAKLYDKDGEVIDDALVLWFENPKSFTGEDVVEFHTHGSPAVIKSLLSRLDEFDGAREAEPGEFTRRAFENGKLDLTEAEGLADLIHAETEAQRKQALRQMEGELGKLYDDWRDRLVRALAHQEADIDFPDEDLPDALPAESRDVVEDLLGQIQTHLSDNQRGQRLREGFYIAILGPPNAGKSSLLNKLARKNAAIVSETAGTTRDVIEVHLDLFGWPVTLADTAGLRESSDLIESEGINRAKEKARQADLKLALFDAASWDQGDIESHDWIDSDTILIANKIDLVHDLRLPTGVLGISAQQGEGLNKLLARLKDEIDARFAPSSTPSLTRARHRKSLEECALHMQSALVAPEPELVAEDLRLAVRALGRITGRVDVEDLLDVIFSDFCIGK